ncbi:MAG: TcpQ domain-containing protein [Aestuariivita sp.]|nr:TcpQ domain-containing protein [Aestuariivita sp.]MCY4345415.1 TcpQ domain-containing protein [Aestuariivita sp.]
MRFGRPWTLLYSRTPPLCQAPFFRARAAALTRGLSVAVATAVAVGIAPALSAALPPVPAPSSIANLIRCPDWQTYVPVISRPAAAEQQTAPQFAARTTDTITTTPLADTTRQTPPSAVGRVPAGSGLPACTLIIRAGDTYSRIAQQQLGNSKRWREIARLNPNLKPEALKVGQTIKLPCAAGTQVATGDNPVVAPPKKPRRGWWIFGGNRPAAKTDRQPAGPRDLQQQAAPPVPTAGADRKVAKATAVVKPKPTLPLWTAKKDEFLADVIKRWGKEAGYTVIVASTDAWQLSVPIRLRAEFEDAVDELIAGMAHDGTPPRVRIYPNAVLRLGGPL